ncbi:ABC transporter ATP-binding protein [uncultured Comamonas sp.]|uniref:ABC transporter ATP-binding protein n=1 Tax=uncultured Comamonas sp. TaxID=114710 RepID=UPI00374A1816
MNTQTPDATAELLLQVSRLNAWYGEAHILFDVGLEVRRGEVVALMGRNGAGKSTTLKAIMGLVERRKGSVQFMGQNIAQADSWRIARLGLGYVPEERRIFSGLTVLENLEVGRQPARRWADGSQASAWTVDDLLAFFPNLAAMPQRPGGQMSGGEQQMLTVARTLMGNPYMVLLDEPSEGVAPVIVEQMAQMILQLKQRGVSILLCEQNLHFARLVSDRAYVLEKGAIQFAGSMQALIDEERAGAKRIGV